MKKNISSKILFLLIFALPQPFSATAAEDSSAFLPSTIQKVSALHLPSLAVQQIAEEAEATKIQTENKNNIAAFKVAAVKESFGSVEQLKTAYLLHDFATYGKTTTERCVLSPETLADLSLFYGNKETPDNHVFAHLNRTKTLSGRVALQTLLAEPTADISKLQNRQAFIKLLITNEQLYAKIMQALKTIHAHEAAFLSITREMQAEIEKDYQEILFELPGLKKLNVHPDIMQFATYAHAGKELATAAILDGIIGGILYGTVAVAANHGEAQRMTLHFLRQITGIAAIRDGGIDNWIVAAGTYVGLGLGIYQLSLRLPTVARLKRKMEGVAKVLVETHRSLVGELKKYSAAHQVLPNLENNSFKKVSAQEKTELLNVLKELDSSYLKAGYAATAFERKNEIKDNFADSYVLMGLVDAYASITTLMKESAENNNGQYCFVEYAHTNTPTVNLNGFWHPMLDAHTVVKNDIVLGSSSMPQNGIITGPNAGGKTTTLRSIALAILIAQTLGIAPADQALITPFSTIATYLHIADSEGKESLFQAEMRRAQGLLNCIKNLQSTQFSFVVMDEIFTGTNPKEGIAGAYGVAKKLASHKNSIALITTHFLDLTSLAEETKAFTNYKVSVQPVGDTFEFPYKLELGITDQAIALQLLSQEGFDSEILAAAHEFMARKQAA